MEGAQGATRLSSSVEHGQTTLRRRQGLAGTRSAQTNARQVCARLRKEARTWMEGQAQGGIDTSLPTGVLLDRNGQGAIRQCPFCSNCTMHAPCARSEMRHPATCVDGTRRSATYAHRHIYSCPPLLGKDASTTQGWPQQSMLSQGPDSFRAARMVASQRGGGITAPLSS